MDAYIAAALCEQSKEDGLTVMCRGGGINYLLAKFIQFYCYGSATHHQSQVDEEDRKLVFVINVKDEEQGGGRHKQTDEHTIMDTLLAEGIPPNRLPTLLTSKTKLDGKREKVFAKGGCFICTSRILIVDILDGKVDAKRISGILVPDAHEIAEGGVEAFIIRKYREQNQTGFVKAFSDQPEEFTGDFGRVERILKALWLKRLYLWPRFRNEVTESLNVEPEVIQLAQPMSTKMKNIQHAILVAMDITIKELQKAVPTMDTSHMVLENGLFKSFFGVIHTQLQPQWPSLSTRTKALVYDLKDLRKLLFLLITQDAVSFYYHLRAMKDQLAEDGYQGHLWMATAASETIFNNARDRVFVIEKVDVTLVARAEKVAREATPAGRKVVSNPAVIDLLTQEEPAAAPTQGGEPSADDQTAFRLELLRKHHFKLSTTLRCVMEPLPKWTLIESVVKEVQEDQRAAPESALRVLSKRVLVLVKDNDCLIRVKEALLYGQASYQDSRYRWFLTQEANRVRRKHRNDANAAKAKAAAAARNKAVSRAAMDSNGRLGSALGGALDMDGEDESQPATMAMMMAASAGHYANLEPSSNSLSTVPLSKIIGNTVEQRQYDQSAAAGINISPRELILKNLFDMEPAHLQRCNEEATLLLLEELRAKNTPALAPKSYLEPISDSKSRGNVRDTSGAEPERKKQRVIGGGNKIKAKDTEDTEEMDSYDYAAEEEELAEKEEESDCSLSGGTKDRGKYKAKGRVEKKSDKVDVGVVFNPTGQQAEPGEGTLLDPDLHYVFMTHAELFRNHNAMSDVNPCAVILYDPVPEVARMLECHQVDRKKEAKRLREKLLRRGKTVASKLEDTDFRVKLYFLMYDGSAEEHHYTASLAKERKAFESLIISKGKMAICLPDLQADLDKIRADDKADTSISVDTRTVKRGVGDQQGGKERVLVIDTREFRRGNFLPSSLDRKACLTVLPRNISVGDYHLSRDLCVERKAIADLIESLRCGRLYSQCEGMLRYFQHPVVLIEFNAEQAFSFPQHGANNTGEFRKDSVQAMLTILLHRFNNVRLLWSRSHMHTANLFERLVKNSVHPVDVVRVETMGAADGQTFDADAAEGESRESREAALAMLNAVPGINKDNVFKVMRSVENLASLAQLTVEELRPLLGLENARACYNFFSKRT